VDWSNQKGKEQGMPGADAGENKVLKARCESVEFELP
jgi:hypothetical protein